MYDFIKIFIRIIWKVVFSFQNDWKNCFRPLNLHFNLFLVFRPNMVLSLMVVRTKLVSMSTNRKKKCF